MAPKGRALKRRDSMPEQGVNPVGLSPMVPMTNIVGFLLALALTKLGVEDRLRGFGLTVDAQTTQLALIGVVAVSLGLLASLVNKARIDYNVPWPFFMLGKGDDHAIAYNQVQRGHQSYLESAIVIVPMVFAIASLAPSTVLVVSQIWALGRFGGSYTYATNPDTKARAKWNWSYLFYFIMHGFVWLGLLNKAGLVSM